MVTVQNFSKRKPTGGRYKSVYTKRLSQAGDVPSHTKIGERRARKKHTAGGNRKTSLLTDKKVNVVDPKTGKATVAEVTNVLETQASRHFTRRNIMTKGAIIETSKGKAKITSRPGQDGVINAVLV